MPASLKPRPERDPGLDVLRGALLTAMLAVHVIPAHGTAAQGQALHGFAGIFLISSGFVALSGYGAALAERSAWHRLERALRLVLVMVAWAVLLSLLRQVLAARPAGCPAPEWLPPARFESIGILLAIALTQLAAPLCRVGQALGTTLAVSFGFVLMLLPAAAAWVPAVGVFHAIYSVMTQRTLTPFYTLTSFVALGLMGAVFAVHVQRLPRVQGPVLRALLVAAAVVLASPRVSGRVLDHGYSAAGHVGGAAATLLYWSLVLLLLLCSSANAPAPAKALRPLALLGRHSLLVFIIHLVLLELNAAVAVRMSLPRGLLSTALLLMVDWAVLVAVALMADRRPRAKEALHTFVLFGSEDRGWVARAALALAIAAVVAAYSGSVLARPNPAVLVHDFERPLKCAASWTFGALTVGRQKQGDAASYSLSVIGDAGALAGHGFGLYLTQEIGPRRTLELDVRGYGARSGRIKIELAEDDNGNWDIEKDPALFVPLYDDRFVFELPVDWTGWRHIRIPLALFRDDNPGRGNDQLDPSRDLTSGGLLELQLLFSPLGVGSTFVQLDVDNLAFTP